VELVQRIEDLEQCGLMGSDRQRRLVGLKRAADEACRDRFLSGAEQQVIAPAALLISAPEVRDADVLALEAGARRLHALEAVGRRLGHPAAYARAVQTMCEALAGLMCRAHHSGGLQPIDLARSIELLAGPEAAEVVLAAAR
jgi:hypothetical protein